MRETKITNIEVLRSETPVRLPAEYLPAWREPGGVPRLAFTVSIFKVHTDEGIVGYAPYWGEPDQATRA